MICGRCQHKAEAHVWKGPGEGETRIGKCALCDCPDWKRNTMKTTCTRSIGIDAGHRVVRHESKCQHLHGHRYTFDITAEADQLDEVGRVIDFGVLKDKIGGWLLDNWDHGLILWDQDPLLPVLADMVVREWGPGPSTTLQKVFAAEFNPTAENLAQFLVRELCPSLLIDTGVRVTRVVVHETPNCKAEASL